MGLKQQANKLNLPDNQSEESENQKNLEKYERYLKKHRLLGKEPPVEFKILPDNRVYISRLKDQDDETQQVAIPDFCMGCETILDENILDYVADEVYINNILIRNPANKPYSISMLCSGITQKHLRLEVAHPENIVQAVHAFARSQQLESIEFVNMNTQNLKHAYHLFENCRNLKHIEGYIDLSHIEDGTRMFKMCKYADKIIKGMNLSSVRDTTGMFQRQSMSGRTLDLSDVTFGNIHIAQRMFYMVQADKIVFSGKGFENVTDAIEMFAYSKIPEIDTQKIGFKNLKLASGMFRNQFVTKVIIGPHMLDKIQQLGDARNIFDNCDDLRTVEIMEQDFTVRNKWEWISLFYQMFSGSNLRKIKVHTQDKNLEHLLNMALLDLIRNEPAY